MNITHYEIPWKINAIAPGCYIVLKFDFHPRILYVPCFFPGENGTTWCGESPSSRNIDYKQQLWDSTVKEKFFAFRVFRLPFFSGWGIHQNWKWDSGTVAFDEAIQSNENWCWMLSDFHRNVFILSDILAFIKLPFYTSWSSRALTYAPKLFQLSDFCNCEILHVRRLFLEKRLREKQKLCLVWQQQISLDFPCSQQTRKKSRQKKERSCEKSGKGKKTWIFLAWINSDFSMCIWHESDMRTNTRRKHPRESCSFHPQTSTRVLELFN